jgi:uncharacterized membrane protein YvbJ
MAKRYCKICGAEWEENFDECWNCGMPADPDEQLWFDKDARRRLERKKRIDRHIKPVSKLNRGIFIPLILGCVAIIKIIAQGGFSIRSGLVYEVVGLLMFVFSLGYIVKIKMK